MKLTVEVTTTKKLKPNQKVTLKSGRFGLAGPDLVICAARTGVELVTVHAPVYSFETKSTGKTEMSITGTVELPEEKMSQVTHITLS